MSVERGAAASAMSSLAFRLGCVLLGAAAACSSSAGGPSAENACADLATARCAERSTCTMFGPPLGGARDGGSDAADASAAVPTATVDAVGNGVSRVYGDMPTCLAREATACRQSLAAPGTGDSPARVELCVGEFPNLSCRAFLDGKLPPDCTVTGARASGVTCTFDAQCASGYCHGVKTADCGTCADPPAAGDECVDSTCGPAQRCVPSTQSCAIFVALNQACDAAHPCDSGLVCVGDDAATMTEGTCEAAGANVGAACGGELPACDAARGLACVGGAGGKTCAPIALVGDGQPCGTLPDGSRADCVSGDCYTATGLAADGAQGTCKVRASTEQSACDTATGPACLPPARCIVSGGGTAGKCMLPDADLCN